MSIHYSYKTEPELPQDRRITNSTQKELLSAELKKLE